jgi:hypothetical protein
LLKYAEPVRQEPVFDELRFEIRCTVNIRISTFLPSTIPQLMNKVVHYLLWTIHFAYFRSLVYRGRPPTVWKNYRRS